MNFSRLWIVGKNNGPTWDFVGVFDDLNKAILACLDKSYFLGPAYMNNELSGTWIGRYYPHEL